MRKESIYRSRNHIPYPFWKNILIYVLKKRQKRQ